MKLKPTISHFRRKPGSVSIAEPPLWHCRAVLLFPLDTESFCFPTNTEEMGDNTVCLLLVPSFLQDVMLEQQLHFFVAPADKYYLCHATLPHRDSTCLPHAGMCPGHKMKYRGKKASLCEGGQTLAQVAWRACGVSIL